MAKVQRIHTGLGRLEIYLQFAPIRREFENEKACPYAHENAQNSESDFLKTPSTCRGKSNIYSHRICFAF